MRKVVSSFEYILILKMASDIRKNGGIDHSISKKVTVVLGAQWGDEGKGKVVDMLATHADLVCRCQVRKCQCHFHRVSLY